VLPHGLRGLRNANNLVASCGECGSAGSIGSGSVPFTPASVLGANGAWWRRASGLFVKNTQPVFANPSFTTDTGWAKGTGWTLPGTTANHASGVTSSVYQAVGITGNHYRMGYDCLSADGTGTCGQFGGALTAYATTTGARIAEADQTAGGVQGVAAHSTTTAVIDNFTCENLSLTTLIPQAATGALAGTTLAQATAAAMPWDDGTGVKFDGSGDYLESSLAASAWPMHKAAGGTFGFKFRTSDAGGVLVGTNNYASASVGFTIALLGGYIDVQVTNGTDQVFRTTDVVTAVADGAEHSVVVAWSSAGLQLRVDSAAVVTAAPGGSGFSAANASFTLRMAMRNGGTTSSDFAGTIRDFVAATGHASDSAQIALLNWLKAQP